jgi:lipopolysaccharide biosynthesis glycosyltransferase
LAPNRPASDAGAASFRSRIRPMLKRGVAHVGPLDRVATRVVERRAAFERLLEMYDKLRGGQRGPRKSIPTVGEIAEVELDVYKARIYAEFFEMASIDGDFDRAAVSMTRKLIERYRGRGGNSRARIIAQLFRQHDKLRPIADICEALCAYDEPMPVPAWTLFTESDLALVMRWAAGEYFQLGFRHDPTTAAASLSRVLNDEVRLAADPDIWIKIAYYAFSADYLDLAEQTLKRADRAMATITNPSRIELLQLRLSSMQDWLDRARRAEQPVEVPAGEVPFALVGFQHPDWGLVSRDLDDPIETLAGLGHLLRHDVAFSGDPDLVSAADQLRKQVSPAQVSGGSKPTVRLYEVDRDVSKHASIPDGTWTIVSEWFTAPLGGAHFDIPMNPKVRPIFISFHITPKELSAPGAIEYLRQYGPIGCREWETVFLLHAAGVPAFFSGALATTVNAVVPPASKAAAQRTMFVDAQPDNPADAKSSRLSVELKRHSLGTNLAEAATALQAYRDGDARIVTSDLRLYLAVRAVGCRADLRPKDVHDYRVIDYLKLDDTALTTMQRGISDKLSSVLGAALAGRPETEVYATWRELCAAEVAQAEAELHSIKGNPELDFDLDEACRIIRSASVVIERTEPGPDGPEINVEFSVDENYKHQLDIVLDSVVERTSRPVRAFVLCRNLGEADYTRMARLFPTVSFVWLPTDNVQYGRIPGKIKWATIVTMDRTILPAVLDDVDRIIHFDLDAMCLSDLAELFDVDMQGTAIAAADEPQLNHSGGFNAFRGSARRVRHEGKPELARELILRTHSVHRFDFNIFNAGIMVLDLAKMRADDFCGRYLAYVQRFGINGQAVLNFYVGGDRAKLDPTWNRLLRLEVGDTPKIAHWAGPFKPWRNHQYVRGRELWREQEVRFAARTRDLEPVVEQVS